MVLGNAARPWPCFLQALSQATLDRSRWEDTSSGHQPDLWNPQEDSLGVLGRVGLRLRPGLQANGSVEQRPRALSKR